METGKPSYLEMARAFKLDIQRSRIPSKVNARVRKQIGSRFAIDFFMLMPARDGNYAAYVFYKSNEALLHGSADGANEAIKELVLRELCNAGEESQQESIVHFEFDSRENVEKHYEGNYDLRMR